MTCSNFPTSSCQLRRFIFSAPTFETKKFLNETYRVYDKLQLSCSEFSRATIESKRKQPQTCAQKLFDKMLPYAWQKNVCHLAFWQFQTVTYGAQYLSLRCPKRKSS